MPFVNLNASQNYLLLALLMGWAVFLFHRYALHYRSSSSPNEQGIIPTWGRLGSSFMLVLAAICLAVFTADSGGKLANYALFIAIGMSLGFIGDIFMAELLPIKNYVIGGIASFGLGHLAYLWAMTNYANFSNPVSLILSILLWLAIGTLGWYIVVLRHHKADFMRLAALPYSLLLAGVTGLACGLTLQQPQFSGLALGTVLFLASDLILAGQLFSGWHFRYIRDVVWLTYGPAQALIVFSVASLI